jgi:two-component system CheB/CheR fusion protein
MTQRSLPDVASHVWNMQEPFRANLDKLRASPDIKESFEFEHRVAGDGTPVFKVRGRVLKPDGEMYLMITIEDMTSLKEAERLLKQERERLATEVASAERELGRTQDELRALAGSLFTSQEDERRRVARDLHDDISQKLAVLAIESQQIVPLMTNDPARAAQDLEQLRVGLGALSEDVRRMSHALHPTVNRRFRYIRSLAGAG